MEDDRYILTCKESYLKGLVPAEEIEKSSTYFIKLKGLADQKIAKGGLSSFKDFLIEGNYGIQLWTAHFLLMRNEAIVPFLEIIADYATHPAKPLIALREMIWLKKYYPEAIGRP